MSSRASWRAATALLEEHVGVTYSCASVRVGRAGETVYAATVGTLDGQGSTRAVPQTRFDVASLTKPICAGTLAMQGVAEGWIDLDQAVAELFPEWDESPAADAAIAQLLGHRAGLPAWRPYYGLLDAFPHAPAGSALARRRIRSAVRAEPLDAPSGSACTYSDVGYLTLGFWLEHRLQAPLHIAFQERVAGPWGLERTGYTPPPPDEAPATERCPWRRRVVRGAVHDENAYAYGIGTAHAGIFASAGDVGRWADLLLASARGVGPLPSDVVRHFWTWSPDQATWRLAFDSLSPGSSSAGERVPLDAVGHLGFTGCSVWIAPSLDATITLLTNRVHPTRDNQSIKALRPVLHDALWEIMSDHIG